MDTGVLLMRVDRMRVVTTVMMMAVGARLAHNAPRSRDRMSHDDGFVRSGDTHYPNGVPVATAWSRFHRVGRSPSIEIGYHGACENPRLIEVDQRAGVTDLTIAKGGCLI